jgi:hypothetical protein
MHNASYSVPYVLLKVPITHPAVSGLLMHSSERFAACGNDVCTDTPVGRLRRFSNRPIGWHLPPTMDHTHRFSQRTSVSSRRSEAWHQ